MATQKSFFAIATDIGGRNENQDRAFALSLQGRTLLVLADGMGGHKGGAMASQAIIEVAERLFRDNPVQDPNTLLPQIVKESCNVIAKENKSQNLDGHSTCVLALIDEKACLSWLRVGDSRLFIFADKTHWWRSIDHTMLDLRVLKGELTDEESRHHPDRPFVFRSVSTTVPDMKVQRFGTLPLGAVLFLCSDGVWDAFPAKELYKITKGENINLITNKIVKTAVARNGVNSDNCTALLYRAPFGDAELHLPHLNLEELHFLPRTTDSERKREKQILVGAISVLALIIIATIGYNFGYTQGDTIATRAVSSCSRQVHQEQNDSNGKGMVRGQVVNSQENKGEDETPKSKPEKEIPKNTGTRITKKPQERHEKEKRTSESKAQKLAEGNTTKGNTKPQPNKTTNDSKPSNPDTTAGPKQPTEQKQGTSNDHRDREEDHDK